MLCQNAFPSILSYLRHTGVLLFALLVMLDQPLYIDMVQRDGLVSCHSSLFFYMSTSSFLLSKEEFLLNTLSLQSHEYLSFYLYVYLSIHLFLVSNNRHPENQEGLVAATLNAIFIHCSCGRVTEILIWLYQIKRYCIDCDNIVHGLIHDHGRLYEIFGYYPGLSSLL